MLYLGRGSSVTQCALCHLYVQTAAVAAGRRPGAERVGQPGGVKIIDMLWVKSLSRADSGRLKPLNAKSNFGLSGV